MAKQIPLGDVLSVTTGKLVSRDHIGGVYNVCDHMTGAANMTHQLGRVSKEITPEIYRQHPWLAGVECPPWNFTDADDAEARKAQIFGWLDIMERQHGAMVSLEPMPTYDAPNPIEELCDMVGSEKVYVVPSSPR